MMMQNTRQAGRGEEEEEERGADLRILGLIIASENVLFALPDKSRIAGFFTQVLISTPGVKACRVCLGEASAQIGELESDACGECEIWRKAATPTEFRCSLEGRTDMRVIAMETYEHFFGFLVLQTDGTDTFESYEPFVNNLANYITLSLENRLQKNLLQEARESLESKVKERTEELRVLNEQLRKEVEKRQMAEEEVRRLNEGLEGRIADLEHQRKLFVGRELRIIELKEKIRKLEQNICVR